MATRRGAGHLGPADGGSRPGGAQAQVDPHHRCRRRASLCPMDWVPDGVTVVNNRGVHAVKGGEFGLMAVLMLHTRMPAIVHNQRAARWESLYSTPIRDKVVAIIGVGHIGGAAAAQCQARRSPGPRGEPSRRAPGRGGRVHSPPIVIDEVLPRADFVLMAAPLTPETRNVLDRRRQSLMKPGCGVVNVGRAGTMDYDALADNLLQRPRIRCHPGCLRPRAAAGGLAPVASPQRHRDAPRIRRRRRRLRARHPGPRVREHGSISRRRAPRQRGQTGAWLLINV